MGDVVNLSKQTVNLSKGESINLTKTTQNLKNVRIGLGWDPVKRNILDIIGSLFGLGKQEYDLDAYVIALSESKAAKVVYYNDLMWSGKGDIYIQHHGDNLTGRGKQMDKEQISINLAAIPKTYDKLVIAVTIYRGKERKQSFGDVHNTFIRVVDTDDNFEICRYSEVDMTQMPDSITFVAGKLVRGAVNDWRFDAVGESTMEGSISEVVSRMTR